MQTHLNIHVDFCALEQLCQYGVLQRIANHPCNFSCSPVALPPSSPITWALSAAGVKGTFPCDHHVRGFSTPVLKAAMAYSQRTIALSSFDCPLLATSLGPNTAAMT